MKEVTKNRIEEYTVYQATDGTEFNSLEECKNYEESALGVIKAKLNKLIVNKDLDAWELMGGFDDHTVTAFRPQTEEDVDTIMQFMLITNSWINTAERKSLRDKRYGIIYDAFENNDVVLFGINCDNEYYFINSRQNIIDNLMNLDKKEESNVK